MTGATGSAVDIEARARAMPRAERRAYLLACGWTRLGATWFHPSRDEPGGDRGFYTLAAATRAALRDAPVTRPRAVIRTAAEVLNDVILRDGPRFSWTVDGHENPIVPCLDCGSLQLRIVLAEVTSTGVAVAVQCRSCGGRPMYLSIDERPLHAGSSYVTVTTD